MADYEINVGRELLPELLNGPEGLAKLVETVLNQVLEAQMTPPNTRSHLRNLLPETLVNGDITAPVLIRALSRALLIPKSSAASTSIRFASPALPKCRADTVGYGKRLAVANSGVLRALFT